MKIQFKPSSYFHTDRSQAAFLLWIFFVICVCLAMLFVFVLLYCLVCFLQPFGRLLLKSWPHNFLVCYVFLWFCHFPVRCLGSGVVLDCIDS